MAGLFFYNVNLRKSESSNELVITGDVENRSGRNYAAVAIRIILFSKNIPLASAVTVVNGLPNGSSRTFEKRFEELDYEKVAHTITRHEVIAENAY